MRDDGWLDSFTPLKLKKMRMSKTDYFLKGSLACAQKQETELNGRETIFDLGYLTSAPYVKMHHDADSLKCR